MFSIQIKEFDANSANESREPVASILLYIKLENPKSNATLSRLTFILLPPIAHAPNGEQLILSYKLNHFGLLSVKGYLFSCFQTLK